MLTPEEITKRADAEDSLPTEPEQASLTPTPPPNATADNVGYCARCPAVIPAGEEFCAAHREGEND